MRTWVSGAEKALLVVACGAVLAACGGSDDGADTGSPAGTGGSADAGGSGGSSAGGTSGGSGHAGAGTGGAATGGSAGKGGSTGTGGAAGKGGSGTGGSAGSNNTGGSSGKGTGGSAGTGTGGSAGTGAGGSAGTGTGGGGAAQGGAGGTSQAGGAGGDMGTGGSAGANAGGAGGDMGTGGIAGSSAIGGAAGTGAGGVAGSSSVGGASTGGSAGASAGGASTGGSAGASAGGAAGTGGAGGCTAAGDACALDDGANGICDATLACAKCGGAGADAACDAAYGSANNPFLCVGGRCAPGDCHKSADCATAGQLCGVTAPNKCGSCAADVECVLDKNYGAGFLCDTKSGDANAGLCVANACTQGEQGKTCALNSSDVCCAKTCIPGSCCNTSDCAAGTCVGHVCTTCDPVDTATGGTFAVDPINGDDSIATGSGAQGGQKTQACAFKTLSRAMQFIEQTKPGGQIGVLVYADALDAAEVYPIVIPPNVAVSKLVTPLVSVSVPPGQRGFILSGKGSMLEGFDIGGGGLAQNGIVVTGGDKSTVLDAVTVHDFASDGIAVLDGGFVTIGGGVTATSCGAAATPASGLAVAGHAAIEIDFGGGSSHFDNNSDHGIAVAGTGVVTINSTTKTVGTVTANNNVHAGLFIVQTPGGPQPLGLNDIHGLVSNGATSGNGIHLFAGSHVKLRASTALGNSGSGVIVSPFQAGMTQVTDITNIDLGVVGDFGENDVQDAATPNLDAGICLDPAFAGGATLQAAGNIFHGIDCGKTAGKITVKKCANKSDVGFTGATNSVVILLCTP